MLRVPVASRNLAAHLERCDRARRVSLARTTQLSLICKRSNLESFRDAIALALSEASPPHGSP